jgi:hypothetical protein
MKYNFWEFFQDIDGSFSFKRAQTALFSVLFAIVIISNLFWKVTLSDNLLEILAFLITYSYTGIAVEKFSKRGISKDN